MFMEKVADIKKRFEEGSLVLSVEITNFVKEWIVNHVMGSDKKYSRCFYVTKHTKASFSHGICPECIAKLYGDIHLKVYGVKTLEFRKMFPLPF